MTWRSPVPRWPGGAPVRRCRRRVDRLPLGVGDCVTATGGRLEQGRPSDAIAGIGIDSRTIASGELFVAIRGDRFDGHDFIAAAVAHGVHGVMVEAPLVERAR